MTFECLKDCKSLELTELSEASVGENIFFVPNGWL